MGLFITNEGEYKGWLASFLCCCAAVQQDETPSEWSRSRPNTREGTSIITQQPQPIPSSHPYITAQRIDSTQSFTKQHDYDDVRIHTTNSSISLPALQPLDLGSSSLLGRRPSTSASDTHRNPRPAASTSSSNRPSFIESRANLVPIKLAPIVLSRSTEALTAQDNDDHLETATPQELTDEMSTDIINNVSSYRASRETPFQRSLRQSADMLASRQAAKQQDTEVTTRQSNDSLRHGSSVSGKSSAASMRRSSHDNLLIQSISDSSVPRLKRKHSGGQSTFRAGEEVDDRDAVELNTIVEEQKVDTPPMASTTEVDNHVPAVAPSMQVHARSQTLTDIGSAFSRPVTARDNTDFDFEQMLKDHSDREQAQQDDNEPETTFLDEEPRMTRSRSRSASQVAKLRSRSSSRVSGWLANIRSASTVSGAQNTSIIDNTATPTSSVRHNVTTTRSTSKVRAYSMSRSSSSTALDSPIATVPSSPISVSQKGNHSRSMTAESNIANPLPSTINEQIAKGGVFFQPTAQAPTAETRLSADLASEKMFLPARSRDSTIAKTERLCEQEGWPALSTTVSNNVGVAL